MVDILVVGTHPDDIELGLGAAIAGWVTEGFDVAMLDLTNGEPTPHGAPAIRAAESAAAAALLGVTQRVTLDLPNRQLVDDVASRRKVAEVYRTLRPDRVFFHAPTDAHPDHINGSAVCHKARFDAKLTKTDMAGQPFYPPKMFHYLSSHLPSIFEPTFILDVSKTFDKKLEALTLYPSQFAANGTEKIIADKLTVLGRYYGELIGVEYGEPIRSVAPLGLASLRDIIL